MVDPHVNNPKSIKYHVKEYINAHKEEFNNKVVLDVPAGNGVTTEVLLANGAKVEAFDLFPEYFKVTEIECKRANIFEKIPVADGHADLLICQEGIEHFCDHIKIFKEFNRVLKPNGRVIVTTPSYSNLSARLSYFLFESENNKQMPPNEINDVWMADKSITNEIYYGHIFLVGLQKLRTVAKLCGFRIKEIRYIRLSWTSLLLFPTFYPIILLVSYLRYLRNVGKHKTIPKKFKQQVYGEQLKININPKNLLNRHTFVIFEKEKESRDVDFRFESTLHSFIDGG